MRRYLLSHIIAHTADVFGVTEDQITGPGRAHKFVHPRWCAIYIATALCPHLSSADIGRAMNRDHTTILHGAASAKALAERDADFELKLLAVLVRTEPLDRAPVLRPRRATAERASFKPVVTPPVRTPMSHTWELTAMSLEDRDEAIGIYFETNVREGSGMLLAAIQREMAA